MSLADYFVVMAVLRGWPTACTTQPATEPTLMQMVGKKPGEDPDRSRLRKTADLVSLTLPSFQNCVSVRPTMWTLGRHWVSWISSAAPSSLNSAVLPLRTWFLDAQPLATHLLRHALFGLVLVALCSLGLHIGCAVMSLARVHTC